MTEQNRTNALSDLTSAGFNSMFAGPMTGAGAPNFDFNTFLNNCQGKNPVMNVFAADNRYTYYDTPDSGPGLVNFINTYKGRTPIFAWSLADDVNYCRDLNSIANWSPSRVSEMNALAKQADPNHLTFISGDGWANDVGQFAKSSAPYMTAADLYGVQVYSIVPGETNPLGVSHDEFTTVTDQADNAVYPAGRAKTAIIGTTQTFRYNTTDWFPNPAQMRNQCYGALIAGVKGLLGYTFKYSLGVGRGSTGRQDFPDQWNLYKSLRPEISTLTPILTDGQLLKNVDNGSSGYARSSLWIYDGRVYVLALNISMGGPTSVNIKLPGYLNGALTNVFPARPSTLSLSNGTLTGNLPAASWTAGSNVSSISGGVCVYSIGLNPLLTNANFESNNLNGWTTTGSTDSVYTTNGYGAKRGNYYATHWKSSAYETYTYQKKTGLANGKYTLKAWVRNSGGQISCQMVAKNYGGAQLNFNIPSTYNSVTSGHVWTPIVLKDINVSNGQCEVGFYSKSVGNQWLHFDEVEFWKQP